MQYSSQKDNNPVLSRLANIFWPIHRSEVKKFFLMALIMFCALFNQNILRILKDSIIIPELGSEVTSFIKVYVVTPVAGLFVVIYAKMNNHLTYPQIYNYLLGFYIITLTIFAFFIFPYASYFHMGPDKLATLMKQYPHYKWFIAMLANWSFVLFYTISEMWPNIFYILLFWQFANEITETEQARRFYTSLSLFGNSSLVIVGGIIWYSSQPNTALQNYFSGVENSVVLIQLSTILVIIFGLIATYVVHYMYYNMLNDPAVYKDAKAEKSKKPKPSLWESFSIIARSRYLWLMLICSAAYGLTINLVEGVWKAKLREYCVTTTEYAGFNGIYIAMTGVIIMIMTIIGNNLIRTFNWFTVAVITPVVIFVTGVLFFTFTILDEMNYFNIIIFASPLALAALVGGAQNILSKGMKYSIWDTSREMLYIPLDQESKTKGKAAVDVVSSKVGKAMSGFVFSTLFTLMPHQNFHTISPHVMVIFSVFCIAWIYALKAISVEYEKIV